MLVDDPMQSWAAASRCDAASALGSDIASDWICCSPPRLLKLRWRRSNEEAGCPLRLARHDADPVGSRTTVLANAAHCRCAPVASHHGIERERKQSVLARIFRGAAAARIFRGYQPCGGAVL